jgi:exopolysaccharide biosynthesis polyprenyl glycosylphosphotransferase
MSSQFSRKPRQFALLLVDVSILYLSLFVALMLRSGSVPSLTYWTDHVGPFSLAFVMWVMIFYTAGLYSLDVVFKFDLFLWRFTLSIVIATLGTAVMFYLDPSANIAPKTLLALFAIVASVGITLWRLLFRRFSTTYFPKLGVAFIGANGTVGEMLAVMKDKAHLGFRTSLVLEEDPASRRAYGELGAPCTADRRELKEKVDSGDVDIVIISDERNLDAETRTLLYSFLDKKIRFLGLPDFYETFFRRVPLGEIDEAWFLENIDLRSKQPYIFIKRLIDLVVSFALALTIPLWPLIALAVVLESRGPAFFIQERLGRGGRRFRVIKFRTMRVEENDHAPTEKADDRITRLGSFLRKARLDELPQIFNTLRGDMSFIGPRPERPEIVSELEKVIPYYRQRLLVKPGMTGWDQVSGEYHSASAEDTYKKLQYDLYYVKNLSLILDVSIFFKTILTVLSRTGR